MSHTLAPDLKKLGIIANKLRQHVIEMTAAAGSGHQGGPLGLAEIFATLYFHELKHDPKNPDWLERDRLILSNGHVCPIRYAAMAEAGYFPIEELLTLRKLGSRLQGHPERTRLPGLESTSGTWCVTSDGEHDEGLHWEAVLAAGKYGLDRLTSIVDRNGIQIDGRTEDVMPLSPLEEKYATFNWHVIPCDGNDLREILRAFDEAKATEGRPTVIVAHTIPGRGVSFMEDDYRWHSQPFKPGEAAAALDELRNAKL